VSDVLWTRLAAPFPVSSVTWAVVAVDEHADEATVAPQVRREALQERLDEVCGVAGWSIDYAPHAAGAVGCTLEVAGVRKAAIVDALPGGAAATADAAFGAAAALLGMTTPLPRVRSTVPYDRDAGETLHDPDLGDVALDGTNGGRVAVSPPRGYAAAAAPAGDDQELEGAPTPAPASRGASDGRSVTGADAASAVDPVAAGESSSEPPAGELGPGPAAGAPDVRAADQQARGLSHDSLQLIDRLLARLRDEGQGLAAARLVVRYGGYGKDPEAARELYGELRALLKRVSGSEVGA
jgi:hypothetical protein